MTQAEVVKNVAEMTCNTPTTVATILDCFGEQALEALKAGDKVPFPKIGILKAVSKEERTGRNPRSGEPLIIPAHNSVKLVPGTHCKRALNSK